MVSCVCVCVHKVLIMMSLVRHTYSFERGKVVEYLHLLKFSLKFVTIIIVFSELTAPREPRPTEAVFLITFI